ncbi:helix-turn-helix domain-containing protein [Flavobacterium sp.]|uniref:helix-turn-helix domain-containing protein n=1 Tax=Flavobacterium sp. TaxID=239 RepID=UPI002623F542|nr:helix-turn-helix domain-containing protein [Flavobacterium sp.]
MYRIKVSIIIFFISFLTFSQTQKEIEFYKSKFFIYPTIGTDSAMYYTNKVFYSKRPIDLAFANAAKWQLLLVTNQKYNEKEFIDKIDFYVKKVPVKKENYFDLSVVYNIKGNTFYKNNGLNKGLANFIIAEKYAVLSHDINQILKVKGNIASIKGDLKLLDEAISEIKSINKLIDGNKINQQKNTNLKFRNNLNLGTFYIEKYKETRKKSYSDSANSVFNKLTIENEGDYDLARIYTKLGILNSELKDYKKATKFYNESIALFLKLKMDKEVLTTYYNLGYNQFLEKNFSQSKKNFIKVIKNHKDSLIDFNFLFAHKYLANIYTSEKSDSAQYYLDKFIVYHSNKTEKEKLELAKSYNEIEKKNLNEEVSLLKNENRKFSKYQYSLIIFITLLMLILIIGFYYNKRKTEEKINLLLKKLKENKNSDIEKNTIPLKVSDENEKKIIDGLLKLERDLYFLKKEFNLHNAAKKIGSNTTYLTSVIKTHKKMSFNDYTNELRINYILNQLIENKKLQNYTIQSLAEVIGYKKGASFSKIFKQKTGVSPFQFIEKLKENKD